MNREMLTPANIITFTRILLSAVLFFLSPSAVPFGLIYLLCGFSDMADGLIARKTHTESKAGAKLDSCADILFLIIVAVKILPIIRLDIWIWMWIAVIAIIKIAGMILRFIGKHSFAPPHSVLNKLTGLLLFVLPLTVTVVDVGYSATAVCAVATLTAVWDIILLKR